MKLNNIVINMKFTRDDARKELSTQMTAKGEKLNLSERSLNEQLDALIPLVANEEMELADFVTKVLPIFKTADANVRNDVSAGINDYKKTNPPKQIIEPTKKEGGEGDSELEKRLAALEEQLAKNEKATRIEAIKKSIVSKLKEKGVKNDEWSNSFISEIAIDEDVDVEAKVTTLLGIYNKMVSLVDSDATPGAAGGSNPNKDLENIIKEASNIVSSQRLDTKE